MRDNDEIIVTVPARPEFVYIIRAVATGAAARLDLPFDTIDDLRMAVDEACTNLLTAGPPAEVLTVRVTPRADGVRVRACTDATTPGWPPGGFERSLAWQVLQALTEDTRLEHSEDGPEVSFRLPIPA